MTELTGNGAINEAKGVTRGCGPINKDCDFKYWNQ
jgi:hypothetical protein